MSSGAITSGLLLEVPTPSPTRPIVGPNTRPPDAKGLIPKALPTIPLNTVEKLPAPGIIRERSPDIAAIAAIAKEHKVLLCVDNTFASPYLQNPLDLGADIVMHSATKYLGGHSDVIAGALIVKDAALGDQLHFQQFATGATLGPMDSFLVLRGIKTLALRVQRHCENGEKVVEYLSNHPKIKTVYYPGLKNHPFHEIAKKQMKAFGGMVSFDFKSGKKEDSIAFLEKLKVFTLAESLGGVESLANHPALMTHASIPADKRAEVGITDDLVRLSVGIEDAEDLIADLEQALS